MTTEPIQSGTPPLVQRVKDILLKPAQTWERIDVEPSSIKGLYAGYVAILAAIGPVCMMIGQLVFPMSILGVTYRPSLMGAVSTAIVSYVLALVGVFIVALIIDALAPSFGGTKNRTQAFKVAAYGSTAAWVAGVFYLVPAVAVLAVLGLYSLYLYYTGLPRLMKVAQDKALPYTAVVVICAIVFWWLAGMLSASLVTAGAIQAGGFADRGTVTLPGGDRVNVSEMEAAARAAERALANPEAVEVIAADALQGLLPASAGNLPRTSVSASSGSMAGLGGSGAQAEYASGDARITLSVADMGAMGALTTMFNVTSSSESDGRYERVGQVDGRMTSESYDRQARTGEYSVVVGNRVVVSAEGANVSMDQLKAAVGAVNAGRIERLLR